ncbi:MAG: phosphate ABC transporter substrate-binding protein [Candidatus Sumerlaeia bacterium]
MRNLMNTRCIALVLCMIIAIFTVSLSHAQEEKVTITGSTTVEPIAAAFAEYYMAKNKGVNIVVNGGGSSLGAKALIDGTCDIADMSRFMKPGEFKLAVEKGITPVAHVVAMDGLAVVVNKKNPVSKITIEQLRDIYAGDIKNWKEIGGPDASIVKIGRDTSSGTYETIHKLVMEADKEDKKETALDVEVVGSNGAVRQAVMSTPNAIGYVGLGFIDELKTIPVNGVEANVDTVVTGTYPIARPLYMWTNGYPELGSHVHRVVTLHLTEEGQDLVEDQEFVPVTKY